MNGLLTSTVEDGGMRYAANIQSQDRRSAAPAGGYSTQITFAPATEHQFQHAITRVVEWGHLYNLSDGPGCPSYLNQWQPGLPFQQQPQGLELAKLAKPLMNCMKVFGNGIGDIIPPRMGDTAEAACTCLDFEQGQWCKHVVCLGYQIISFCEVDPFYPFTLKQINMDRFCRVLKEAHAAQSRKRGRDPADHGSSKKPRGSAGSSDDPIVLD